MPETVYDARHVLWVDQQETMTDFRAHCSCGWRSACGYGDTWAGEAGCDHLKCVRESPPARCLDAA